MQRPERYQALLLGPAHGKGCGPQDRNYARKNPAKAGSVLGRHNLTSAHCAPVIQTKPTELTPLTIGLRLFAPKRFFFA
jgi:hypothetical protein